MSNKSVVVGLDIGTTKIACFVGVKNEFNKIEIISMGQHESLGVSRGVVANIDNTVDAIKKAVHEAEEKLDGKLTIRVVNVGIAGQHIRSIQHQGSLVRKNIDEQVQQKDIDQLIEDMLFLAMKPGEEIIHVLPQEYIIDGQPPVSNPIGSPGIHIEANFHVIIGDVQSGKNINKCVSQAGLQTKDMILEPLASSAAVLSKEEKEGGVVLVDIGGGTTDIAIFEGETIRHTAVIPFGGNIVTEDIKKGCNILKKQAEQLKVQFGKALAVNDKNQAPRNEVVCIPGFKGRSPKEISINNLTGIIQARMEEILEMVNLEIHKSGFADKLIAGIVLTGGGARLEHLKQLCEYITGIETRIGQPTEHLASINEEDMLSPIYSTGIGLVIMGFENEDANKQFLIEKEEPVAEKTIAEEDPIVEEPIAKERKKVIKGHSKGLLKGKFYDKIVGFKNSIQEIFDYEDEE